MLHPVENPVIEQEITMTPTSRREVLRTAPYTPRTGNQTGNRSGAGPPRSGNLAQQIRGLSEIDRAKLYRETFGAEDEDDEDLPFSQ